MKKGILFVLVLFGVSILAMGCETVRTLDAPADSYNIRKPADTTRPIRQEDTVIIERIY